MQIDKEQWIELSKNVQTLNTMQPLTLHELERLSKCYDSLDEKLDNKLTAIDKKLSAVDKTLSVKIGKLDTKASVFWGIIGGGIPILIYLIIEVTFFKGV